MQHIITVEGRSLIRTFLAGATKDDTISSRALKSVDAHKKTDFLCAFCVLMDNLFPFFLLFRIFCINLQRYCGSTYVD